ncbi:MAG: restriction endonuclease subunit S [Micrococcales bacterium]|nr:restriction endonuclease subunit S [Micrococcales bacterium]
MIDWKSSALDVLCEVEYGTRVTRKRDGGTKYPVYGGGGATFNLDDFNRQDQMIVSRFAMSEECVRFVTGKFFLNDSGLTVRTRDESKLSQEFLDQQLLARSKEIYATARGTAQKNMDMDMFRAMELSYPDSLEEQKRIVALLDDATARITELTACYEQARTHANNLFTSALRDALKSNPDWPVKTLGEIISLAYGKPLDAKDRHDSGAIPVYGANGVKAWSKRSLVDGPSIIVGRKGSAGEINLCNGPFWPLDVTYYVEHDAKETDLEFLYFLLSLMDLPGLAKGVKPGINRNEVYGLTTQVPPLQEQKRSVARLNQTRAKTAEMVAAYDAKLQAAKNLRQSILEAAFAGEL